MKKVCTFMLFLLLCVPPAWGGGPVVQSKALTSNNPALDVEGGNSSPATTHDLIAAEVEETTNDYFGCKDLSGHRPDEDAMPNMDFANMKDKLDVLLDDSVQLSFRFLNSSTMFDDNSQYAAVDSFNNDPMQEKKEDPLSTFVVIKIDF